MATYRKKGDDPMVSCPFNPAHRMLRSRLQMHITKCKQDYPGANKKTCPFNAKHRIDEAEFSHHLMVCPDKGLVERKIAYDSANDVYRGNTQVPTYANEVQPSQNEYWDDDPDEDPQTTKRTNKKPLFKDPMLLCQMKPAERRKYYESLHRRQSDDEGEDSDDLKEPVVQRKVLKELPQPKLLVQPQEDQNDPWENLYAAGPSGRGRIAANIFGQAADSALYTCTPYHPGGMARGRGRGAEAVNVANYPQVPNSFVMNSG